MEFASMEQQTTLTTMDSQFSTHADMVTVLNAFEKGDRVHLAWTLDQLKAFLESDLQYMRHIGLTPQDILTDSATITEVLRAHHNYILKFDTPSVNKLLGDTWVFSDGDITNEGHARTADMANVMDNDWIPCVEAVKLMRPYQLWEAQNPLGTSGYRFLHVVDPTPIFHYLSGRASLQQGVWMVTPQHDIMYGQPVVDDMVGLIRLVSDDFRTYVPETQQHTADMANVLEFNTTEVKIGDERLDEDFALYLIRDIGTGEELVYSWGEKLSNGQVNYLQEYSGDVHCIMEDEGPNEVYRIEPLEFVVEHTTPAEDEYPTGEQRPRTAGILKVGLRYHNPLIVWSFEIVKRGTWGALHAEFPAAYTREDDVPQSNDTEVFVSRSKGNTFIDTVAAMESQYGRGDIVPVTADIVDAPGVRGVLPVGTRLGLNQSDKVYVVLSEGLLSQILKEYPDAYFGSDVADYVDAHELEELPMNTYVVATKQEGLGYDPVYIDLLEDMERRIGEELYTVLSPLEHTADALGLSDLKRRYTPPLRVGERVWIFEGWGLAGGRHGEIRPFSERHWRDVPGMYRDPDRQREVLVRLDDGGYEFVYRGHLRREVPTEAEQCTADILDVFKDKWPAGYSRGQVIWHTQSWAPFILQDVDTKANLLRAYPSAQGQYTFQVSTPPDGLGYAIFPKDEPQRMYLQDLSFLFTHYLTYDPVARMHETHRQQTQADIVDVLQPKFIQQHDSLYTYKVVDNGTLRDLYAQYNTRPEFNVWTGDMPAFAWSASRDPTVINKYGDRQGYLLSRVDDVDDSFYLFIDLDRYARKYHEIDHPIRRQADIIDVLKTDEPPPESSLDADDASDFARSLKRIGFTDGVDVSPAISLYEYEVLRNPVTCETVVFKGDESNPQKGSFGIATISMDEVHDYIDGEDDAWFTPFGMDRETYLSGLHPSHLAQSIRVSSYLVGWSFPLSFAGILAHYWPRIGPLQGVANVNVRQADSLDVAQEAEPFYAPREWNIGDRYRMENDTRTFTIIDAGALNGMFETYLDVHNDIDDIYELDPSTITLISQEDDSGVRWMDTEFHLSGDEEHGVIVRLPRRVQADIVDILSREWNVGDQYVWETSGFAYEIVDEGMWGVLRKKYPHAFVNDNGVEDATLGYISRYVQQYPDAGPQFIFDTKESLNDDFNTGKLIKTADMIDVPDAWNIGTRYFVGGDRVEFEIVDIGSLQEMVDKYSRLNLRTLSDREVRGTIIWVSRQVKQTVLSESSMAYWADTAESLADDLRTGFMKLADIIDPTISEGSVWEYTSKVRYETPGYGRSRAPFYRAWVKRVMLMSQLLAEHGQTDTRDVYPYAGRGFGHWPMDVEYQLNQEQRQKGGLDPWVAIIDGVPLSTRKRILPMTEMWVPVQYLMDEATNIGQASTLREAIEMPSPGMEMTAGKDIIYRGSNFFVSPTGQRIDVENYHAETASQIVKSIYHTTVKDGGEAVDFLFDHNWMRVNDNFEDGELGIEARYLTAETKSACIELAVARPDTDLLMDIGGRIVFHGSSDTFVEKDVLEVTAGAGAGNDYSPKWENFFITPGGQHEDAEDSHITSAVDWVHRWYDTEGTDDLSERLGLRGCLPFLFDHGWVRVSQYLGGRGGEIDVEARHFTSTTKDALIDLIMENPDKRFLIELGGQFVFQGQGRTLLDDTGILRVTASIQSSAHSFFRSAAIRLPDGRVYEGDWHSDAYYAFLNDDYPEMLPSEDERRYVAMPEFILDDPGYSEGFVTYTGEYVTREEAAQMVGLPEEQGEVSEFENLGLIGAVTADAIDILRGGGQYYMRGYPEWIYEVVARGTLGALYAQYGQRRPQFNFQVKEFGTGARSAANHLHDLTAFGQRWGYLLQYVPSHGEPVEDSWYIFVDNAIFQKDFPPVQ
jgi:hypothetical protein